MLNGDRAVEAAGVEGVDDPVPVELTPAGDAVPPPAVVLVPDAGDRLPEEAVPSEGSRVHLDVFGLDVEHPACLEARAEGIDRIDAQPDQVRGVIVQVQPEAEQPVPQLGRVREVARIPVGVPALHRAVLDDEPDPVVLGVPDQFRQQLLGLPQVVRHRPCSVPTDERADVRHAERRGGADACLEMAVNPLTLSRVSDEVVLVAAHCGKGQTVLGEQRPDAVGVYGRAVHLKVGGVVRVVATGRPRRDFQGVVAS